MADAIAVLNAGSSSIKFSLFAQTGADLALAVRGQVEALHTAPSFVAKSATGETISSHAWDEGTRLGHDGALDDTANQAGGPHIGTAASKTAAWVVPTNEELMIARHTRRVLG